MDIWKLAVIAVLATCFGSFLKMYKQEWSVYIMLAAGVLIALNLFEKFAQLISFYESVNGMFGNMTRQMSIIWKSLGVAYICDFSANVCKDTGNNLLADQVSICGKIAILLLGMPILMTLIETIEGYGL